MQPPKSSIIGRRPHFVARSSPEPGQEIDIETSARVAQPSRPRVINQNEHCIGCGYLLRGLHAYSKCPECGEPIISSLIVKPDTLAACDPRALRLSIRGIWLIILGQSLGAALITASPAIWLMLRSQLPTPALVIITATIEFAAALGSACLLNLGAWRISMPLQVRARTRTESDLLCWSLRCSAALLSAVLLFWALHRLVPVGRAFYFRVFGTLITDTIVLYAASLLFLTVFNFALRTRLAVMLDVIDCEPLADKLFRIRWMRPIIGTLTVLLLFLFGHGLVGIGFIPLAISVLITIVVAIWALIVQPTAHISSLVEVQIAFKSACRRHPHKVARSQWIQH